MGKNSLTTEDKLDENELTVLEDAYYDKLDTDPKYSISVDPTNKYHMCEEHKIFISNFVQYKNISLAAKLTGIDEEQALEYYNQYSTKMELKRLNLALYHRTFATKMLNLDELGGWLTSIIIGENVAEADKIQTKDKMTAARMIMDIHKMKQEGFQDPDNVIDVDIQEQFENLSVETLKQMLTTSQKVAQEKAKKQNTLKEDEISDYYSKKEDEEKNEEIEKQIQHLKDLSSSEIVSMLEETNASENPNETLTEKLAAIKKKKEETESEKVSDDNDYNF